MLSKKPQSSPEIEIAAFVIAGFAAGSTLGTNAGAAAVTVGALSGPSKFPQSSPQSSSGSGAFGFSTFRGSICGLKAACGFADAAESGLTVCRDVGLEDGREETKDSKASISSIPLLEVPIGLTEGGGRIEVGAAAKEEAGLDVCREVGLDDGREDTKDSKASISSITPPEVPIVGTKGVGIVALGVAAGIDVAGLVSKMLQSPISLEGLAGRDILLDCMLSFRVPVTEAALSLIDAEVDGLILGMTPAKATDFFALCIGFGDPDIDDRFSDAVLDKGCDIPATLGGRGKSVLGRGELLFGVSIPFRGLPGLDLSTEGLVDDGKSTAAVSPQPKFAAIGDGVGVSFVPGPTLMDFFAGMCFGLVEDAGSPQPNIVRGELVLFPREPPVLFSIIHFATMPVMSSLTFDFGQLTRT